MADLFHANPGAYQTFRAVRIPDRMVKTACEEAGCRHWREGWKSLIDESTPLGAKQARYIREESGRAFTDHKTFADDGVTVLTCFDFEPHQRCFREHETQGGFLVVQAGDVNRALGTIREHVNSRDWQEDFEEHQGRLADQAARG